METIKDITIRINSAVEILEHRKQHPQIFKDNQKAVIEILELQNELNKAIKLITK